MSFIRLYIPDYSNPSTIIVVVKGFVQWRQLSKLSQIAIRGVMCPIKPKPLKSLNDDNGNGNGNGDGDKKQKDKDTDKANEEKKRRR